ncbi:hypothetical protein JAAARDRAFT_201151 [Jaapia argillacea MUCL 33604]|uniref:Uncharacterized protein n=1 Tax=Jaapia argillacea MUCL 33604 TaxID=933084 RepID=A0A067PF21_9AGAM|nr:hypothetical protein JAAARDRAFT_201151 [Jaapia argillacea MUCL 33604]
MEPIRPPGNAESIWNLLDPVQQLAILEKMKQSGLESLPTTGRPHDFNHDGPSGPKFPHLKRQSMDQVIDPALQDIPNAAERPVTQRFTSDALYPGLLKVPHDELVNGQEELYDMISKLRDESARTYGQSTSSARGRKKARTSRKIAKLKKILVVEPGSEGEDGSEEADGEGEGEGLDFDDVLVCPDGHKDLSLPKATLSAIVREARDKLMDLEARKFREICGVGNPIRLPTESRHYTISTTNNYPSLGTYKPQVPHSGVLAKDPWPDPAEQRLIPHLKNLVYYTPVFNATVAHPDNEEIFCQVASLLYEELTTMKKINVPMALCDPSIWYSPETIYEMVKTTFRGFKVKAKAQDDEDTAIRVAKNASSTRRMERRRQATPIYKARHGVDPMVLITEEHMSDAASGPESDAEESRGGWKLQMAHEVGMDIHKISVVEWEKLFFLEEIKCRWRGESLGNIFHELADDEWNMKTPHQKKAIKAIKISSTNRISSAPPAIALYNFGISKTWWKKYSSHFKDVVGDWYQYPDPPGFGENTDTGSADHDNEDTTPKENTQSEDKDTNRHHSQRQDDNNSIKYLSAGETEDRQGPHKSKIQHEDDHDLDDWYEWR